MWISQGYVYEPSQLKDFVVGYVLYEDKISIHGRMKIGGVEYDSSTSPNDVVFISPPFSNPIGTGEVYSGGSWESVDLKPFVVPSPPGLSGLFDIDFRADGTFVPLGGWVTFEKSIWFGAEPDGIYIYGQINDNDIRNNWPQISVPINSGLYIRDYLPLHMFDMFIVASAGNAAGTPSLIMSYAYGIIVEDIISAQTAPDYYFSVSPKIKVPNSGIRFVTEPNVEVTSIVKPFTKYTISSAVANGVVKVLLRDGTIRLLVSKPAIGGFDLYEVSNTGATRMFEDLWGDEYHGAQLGYLLDGTLVSYAWRISYFEGDETHNAGIRYGLYFKRSLNDGQAWEIQQTVAEDLTGVQGLPLLTQNITTGRLQLGNYHSDNMGLDWTVNA